MKRFLRKKRAQGSVWAAVYFAGLVVAQAQLSSNASPGASLSVAPLQHLSLVDAQRLAFERNWDLLAAAAGVDAATAQKIVARELPNPTFSLSTTYINVGNQPSSTPEGNTYWDRNYDTTFAINQLFEIGGKRRSRKLSAQAGFEGAKPSSLTPGACWTSPSPKRTSPRHRRRKMS